ncbi:MAG: VWA domain-containing protein, partial [Chloroflexi bacterium]|nr:VWA domain-containing protein [Chloroflexota bacterium]
KGTWKSGTLSSRFFEYSPSLLRYMTLGEFRRFVNFLDALSRRSYDLANECLTSAEGVFRGMEKQDRRGFLSLVSSMVELNWRDAKASFEAGGTILSRIDREQRGRFLDLADRFAKRDASHIQTFLIEASKALAEMDGQTQGHLLKLSGALLVESPYAVIDFLRTSPQVLEKIPRGDLDRWFQEGMAILSENEEGGIAYFRLESVKGKGVLEELSSGVELDKIRDILWMYAVALAGTDVQILASEDLKERGIGWVSAEHPTTEGRAVYLPYFVRKYPTKEENFSWYKVVGTHQVAHLEFGSFRFIFDKEAAHFPNLRQEWLARVPQSTDATVDLEKYFNLFAERLLAYDLFTLTEDNRLDARVLHEYKGIAKAYRRTQKGAVEERPPIDSLPLREAIVELLIRISLDQRTDLKLPTKIREQVVELIRILSMVRPPTATVEDSAEATIRLYDYISKLANREIPPEDWEDIDADDMEPKPDVDMSVPPEYAAEGEAGGDQPATPEGGESQEEQPYDVPQQVGYRGEFKPELVQLLAKMREGQQAQESGASGEPISPEALRELLEKSVEIEIDQVSEGEITNSTGLFVDNLMGQIGQEQQEAGKGHNVDTTPPDGGPLQTEQALTFLYDEWDFRANDYKPNWCIVKERIMEEGDNGFYDKTLQEYSLLQAQIKRQFELLAPEQLRKVRRLPDGDDIEYDAVVEAMVEKATGNSPSDKIYWRRNKVQRDVAVAFLLDMSASTAEAIDDARKSVDDWSPPDDPREYLAWLRARREEGSRRSYKRIIDVEKEGVVLLIRALETIGDQYGIYGFSGYGRENVEFYVIKDLGEPFSDKVKNRIDKISPLHATRMGPAIRHAVSKLEVQEARTKVLFLISDGRPQDRGYSREGVEKEYAVHDTKKALQEARAKHIVPFCLTVDRGGHDYLKTMCQDMGYEVVAEIESLPKRLPYLYRQLTV